MSVGQTLTAARDERGMTVDELSQATRIRATLIRAIEADDFSMCGGDVYARGHLRSITRVLGIDPEPVIAEFDASHPREEQTSTVEAIGHEWTPVARDKRGPAWGMAMLVAVLLGLSATAAFSLLGNAGGDSQVADPTTSLPVVQTTDPSIDPSIEPTVEPTTPSPAPAPTPTDLIAERPGVNLRLTLVGEQCWIGVTYSDGEQPSFTLRGEDNVLELQDDREIRLVIGDAGAVEVTYNGEDLGTLGGPGEVVRETFTVAEPTESAG